MAEGLFKMKSREHLDDSDLAPSASEEPIKTRDDTQANDTSGIIITKLAELPEKALMDERALAEVLGVTKRTIRRMVARYELPPGILFGGRKRWQAGQVLRWFEAEAERMADQAEKEARKFRSLT